MSATLVIDTSYGSTVGVLGHQPIVETDSRTHVERLQVDISHALEAAGVGKDSLERIVVGIGPGPYTGLRVGIVAAKAIAYATGAALLGVDVLTPQSALVLAALIHHPSLAFFPPTAAITAAAEREVGGTVRHLTLAVNDARRKQLYFALYDQTSIDRRTLRLRTPPRTLIRMDIDTPEHLVTRVNDAVDGLISKFPSTDYVVDVVGRGVGRYSAAWEALSHLDTTVDASVLDAGAFGLDLFSQCAGWEPARDVAPLYLRRPDVSVPNPLKHVLAAVPPVQNARR